MCAVSCEGERDLSSGFASWNFLKIDGWNVPKIRVKILLISILPTSWANNNIGDIATSLGKWVKSYKTFEVLRNPPKSSEIPWFGFFSCLKNQKWVILEDFDRSKMTKVLWNPVFCVFLVLVKGKNPKIQSNHRFQNFFYIIKKFFFLLKSKIVFKNGGLDGFLDYFVVMSY